MVECSHLLFCLHRAMCLATPCIYFVTVYLLNNNLVNCYPSVCIHVDTTEGILMRVFTYSITVCLCCFESVFTVVLFVDYSINFDYYLLGKEGYVFGSVGLSVCLSVCGQHYSQSYKRIAMKLYGGVSGSTIMN